MDLYSPIKGLHFSLLKKSSRIKIVFHSPGYDTVPVPWGVSFFEPKNRINIEFLTKQENILTHYR